MKYIVVLGDGMADWKCDEIDGKTPIEFANTPNMNEIALKGRMGLLKTVPDGYEPGSDVANLGVLGYDAAKCYTGRGALEAVSMGIDLKPNEVAYRCNVVTIGGSGADSIMADSTAGHMSSEESAKLFAELNERLPKNVKGYPGVSYRNLLVVTDGKGAKTKPPHDIVNQKIAEYMPSGNDAKLLEECSKIAHEVFKNSEVNKKRIAAGKNPATDIWAWSGGKKPVLDDFKKKYKVNGGMISAVDLLNGIAKCAGLKTISVPGATGYLDTDYKAKADYAIKALKDGLDFVYMHVEAPDEAGHLGNLKEKVLAIERLDGAIGEILAAFKEDELTIAVLPDHPTPIALRTHTSDPIPFVIMGPAFKADECKVYSEAEAKAHGGFGLMDAKEFLFTLFGSKNA